MTERRMFFRGRTLKGGFIVLSEKAPKLECTVRNLLKDRRGLAGVHHLRPAAKFRSGDRWNGAPLPFAMANRQQDRRYL